MPIESRVWMRCLPGSLRNPPYQVTFHQSSLESSTSMIRSPGLGGESWAAYGAGRTCPLHIPIVLGPQILCIPLSWGRILDALGRRIPRDHRHSRYSPGQNWGRGRSHAISTNHSWILGSSTPLRAQRPQAYQEKVPEGPSHVPRSGSTEP